MAADWVEYVIWWHVYPLGFVGAEPDLAEAQPEPHRLGRLRGWLDHLVSLGCNGLLLGPIFTSSTHGYDTVDYRRIDPRLGDDRDFDALVAACRERGIRVLLDGVFNHVGREFPAAQDALTNGRDSEWADWFTLYDTDGVITAEYFEGHDQLVTLNHRSPKVQVLVGDVMRHWLDRGIDGWRLDAAYAVPAEFWAAVVPRLRAEYPDAWFVGEMIHGDYAAYVRESGLDSVTQYELWAGIWSSIENTNFWELDHTLGRHATLLESCVPMTFLSNHDVTRVASQIKDPRHLAHAIVLLGFLPGVPSIYYGDDFGLHAVKENRAGGDDAVRPELPSERGLFRGGDADVEALYRKIIGLRRRTPWLVDARIRTERVANQQLTITAEPRNGGRDPLTLTLNLGDEPYALPDHATVLASGGPGKGRLAAHSWVITS